MRTRPIHLLCACLTSAGLGLANPIAATADGPHEPNDSVAGAAGPLNGGQIYDGGLETPNDEDYFFFYSSSARQIDITFDVVPTPACTSTSTAYRGMSLYLINDAGTRVASTLDQAKPTDPAHHILYTTSGPAKYYLRVWNGTSTSVAGCTYTLRIDPADALAQMPAPPPPPPPPPADAPAVIEKSRAAMLTRQSVRFSYEVDEPGFEVHRLSLGGRFVRSFRGSTNSGAFRIKLNLDRRARASVRKAFRQGRSIVFTWKVMFRDEGGNETNESFRLRFRRYGSSS